MGLGLVFFAQIEIIKMMKSTSVTAGSKKFQVKVKPLKLEGLNLNLNGCDQEKEEKVIVEEMKWRRLKSGLVSLYRHSSKHLRNVSAPVVLKRGEVIQWDDAFDLSIFQKDDFFHPWDVSFNLLHGRFTEPTKKLAVIGSVSLNIAELASLVEPQTERKLPIAIRVAGVSSEATLLISVSFVEIRNSQDSPELVHDAGGSTKEDGFFGIVKDLMYVSKKKKKKKQSPKNNGGDMSDDSYSGDSDEPGTNSEATPDADNELGQGTTKDGRENSSETQLNRLRVRRPIWDRYLRLGSSRGRREG